MKQQPPSYKLNWHSSDNQSELGKKDEIDESNIIIIQTNIYNSLRKERYYKLNAASKY